MDQPTGPPRARTRRKFFSQEERQRAAEHSPLPPETSTTAIEPHPEPTSPILYDHDSERRNLLAEINSLKTQDNTLETTNKTLNRKIQKLEAEKEDLAEQLYRANLYTSDQSQQIENLKTTIRSHGEEDKAGLINLYARLNEREKISTQQATNLENANCELANLDARLETLEDEKDSWAAKNYTLITRLERVKATNRQFRKIKNITLIEDLRAKSVQLYGLIKDQAVLHEERMHLLEHELAEYWKEKCDGWEHKCRRYKDQRDEAKWQRDQMRSPSGYEEREYLSDEEEWDEKWKERSAGLMRKWVSVV